VVWTLVYKFIIQFLGSVPTLEVVAIVVAIGVRQYHTHRFLEGGSRVSSPLKSRPTAFRNATSYSIVEIYRHF